MSSEVLAQQLTPKQREAAAALVENEFKGKGEKLTLIELAESLGISERTLYEWRTANPSFNAYKESICDSVMKSRLEFIDAQLMKLVEGTSNNGTPSIKAIELAYKRNGKLQTVATTTEDRLVERKPIDANELQERIAALRKN